MSVVFHLLLLSVTASQPVAATAVVPASASVAAPAVVTASALGVAPAVVPASAPGVAPAVVPASAPGVARRGTGVQYQGQERQEARDERLRRGTAALRRGDVERALAILEPLATRRPRDPEILYYLGLARLGAGQPADAAQALESAERWSPSFNPSVTYQLGVALMRTGRLEEARSRFDALRERDPEAPLPRMNLGWILLQRGRGQEALALFEEVASDHPDLAMAHHYVAQVHHANGRREQAREAYLRALEADPEWADAHLALGRLGLEDEELERAGEHLAEAARLRPRDPEARFLSGMVALRRGDLESAAAALRTTLELRPDHAGALYNLGLTLRRQGRAAEAARLMDRFAGLRPTDPDREALAGQAESRSQRLYRQGLGELEAGRPAVAAARFRRAVEAAGEAVPARFLVALGGALLADGRVEEARPTLEEAVRRDPETAPGYRLLAQVYAALGMTAEADRARRTWRSLSGR